MVLSKEELTKVQGGSKTLWFIVGVIGTFLAGLFDGIVNPNRCNSDFDSD